MSHSSIGRFSYNQLRTLPEAGSTSNWVVSMRGRTELNLIAGKYIPAITVKYVNYTVKTNKVSVAGLYDISFINHIDTIPDTISMSVVDTDVKSVRKCMEKWVSAYKWQYGLTPSLGKMKSQSALLDIWHFTKDNKKYYKDSFYVLPSGDMDFNGDQSFALDTLSLEFLVVGRE